jgi:cytochrome oxidase assembly protein ShyY1
MSRASRSDSTPTSASEPAVRPFLTPRWLVSHVFVLTMVVVMTALGFWQLGRLDERKDRNVEVRSALEADPVVIENLLGTDPPQHTSVIAGGEYLDEHSFLVANRTFESQPGFWLATPMRLDDGRVVVVSRGWVPRLWVAGLDQRVVETPAGRIEVLGRVRESVEGGRIGDGATTLPEVSRIDLPMVEELLGIAVEDSWVQLAVQAPPLGDLPVPVPRPSLDEGPHLSYAFQWFFFSLGTVVVYGLILRSRRREPADE